MYKLIKHPITKQIDIIYREDGAFIPINNDNIDYQNYLKWVAEGNTPEAAE